MFPPCSALHGGARGWIRISPDPFALAAAEAAADEDGDEDDPGQHRQGDDQNLEVDWKHRQTGIRAPTHETGGPPILSSKPEHTENGALTYKGRRLASNPPPTSRGKKGYNYKLKLWISTKEQHRRARRVNVQPVLTHKVAQSAVVM